MVRWENMSKIRLSPAYLGYIQSPNNDKKVLTRKRYFLQDITKPRKYKNKDVIYAKQENPEECWIKFMFGSEKYHHTMNIDLDRVSRSHWMFSILDYLAKIDSSNYD